MVASDGEDRSGDSGAALVNERGELVGIHAAFAFADRSSCALDVAAVKEFLREAREKAAARVKIAAKAS
jgi:hypothetical protein